jgi:DnaJ C terminal domain
MIPVNKECLGSCDNEILKLEIQIQTAPPSPSYIYFIFHSFFVSEMNFTHSPSSYSFDVPLKTSSSASEQFVSCGLELEELHIGGIKDVLIKRKCADGNEETKFLQVKITPGWKAGTKIRFGGEGNYDEKTRKYGTIVIIIQELLHPRFSRLNSDLIHSRFISYRDVLLGAVPSSLTTICGEIINIDISQRLLTPTDNRIVIPGKGMIDRKTQVRGNLIIDFTILFPVRSLTQQEKDIISELDCFKERNLMHMDPSFRKEKI